MSDLATTPQPTANTASPKRSAAREALFDLKTQIGKSVLGQDHMVESMLIGLLANGNLLIESLPRTCQDAREDACKTSGGGSVARAVHAGPAAIGCDRRGNLRSDR